jgi:diguanylate cyclase (GGDEF)-like protein
MNIVPYRKSFTVYVADSDIGSGGRIVKMLSDAGYICEHKMNSQSLLSEIFKSPPHIIILRYEDTHFFNGNDAHAAFIEKLINHLPEVHLLVAANKSNINKACDLFGSGVYDCFEWPLQNNHMLLRAIDRAAENDYYMYLNEQLQAKSTTASEPAESSFAYLHLFLKEIESAPSVQVMIDIWLKEAARHLGVSEGIYFRYVEARKVLVAAHAIGYNIQDLENVGVQFAQSEPGFEEKMLEKPNKLRSLHDFILKGLGKSDAACFTLKVNHQYLGVFVIPARADRGFSDDMKESAYLGTSLSILVRQIISFEASEKYKRLTIFDGQSEALDATYSVKKIKEEISRSRRILKPVSLVMISIENYGDMSLLHSKENMNLFVYTVAQILVKNSRLNDLVGRLQLDQFIICLPHTDKRGAAIKAERIRKLFEAADFTAVLGGQTKIKVSVGVSEYPSVCHDAEGLIQTAEQAMLVVKKSGGGRISIAPQPEKFTPDFIVKDGHHVQTHAR